MMSYTNNLARGFPDGPITKQPVSQLPWGKPTIGLLLSHKKNKLVAEYPLRGLDQSIAVAAWQTQLSESLPEDLRSSLPSIAEIEAELARDLQNEPEAQP